MSGRFGNRNALRHGSASRKVGKTPEYRIWIAMRSRCNNPKTIGFAHYGGKGVEVCQRWASFASFLADMGLRPSPKHTIDRVDSKGNYEPGNCRWATWMEQQNNRASNKRVLHEGRYFTIAELARHLGVKYSTLYGRLKRATEAA